MLFDQPLSTLKSASLALMLLSLSHCVSYEPAVLVPAVTLSAEDVNLLPASDVQVDFGLDVAVNESDSLFNVETLPGVRVRAVGANGPAANAGITVGDIILQINGTETNHPDALTALQQLNSESNSYTFIVQRNTVVFEAQLLAQQLSENSAPVELYRVDPLVTRAGYRTELVQIGNEPAIAAALIVDIRPDSPLPQVGLAEGDIILALNGRFINSAQDLVSRLNLEHEPGDDVTLSRYNGTDVADIAVQLWDPGRRVSRVSLGPLFQYESSLSPDSESISFLDLWLFSVYSYRQQEGERSHSLLGLINFSSDSGELIEESN